MMDELDGNGAAGLLQEVFGAAMTVALATCASCGSATQLGESVLYAGGPGDGHPLSHLCGRAGGHHRVRGRHCVDLTGIRTLGMPAVAKRG